MLFNSCWIAHIAREKHKTTMLVIRRTRILTFVDRKATRQHVASWMNHRGRYVIVGTQPSCLEVVLHSYDYKRLYSDRSGSPYRCILVKSSILTDGIKHPIPVPR